MVEKSDIDGLSRTDTIAFLLNTYADKPIEIQYGEMGKALSNAEEFKWKRNARAVILYLAKRRAEPHQWARAVIQVHEDWGVDLENGTTTDFLGEEFWSKDDE